MTDHAWSMPEGAIAIVGMAGRFPGANDIDELADVLFNGRETIQRFSREELLTAGLSPSLVDRPDYVPAAGVVRGHDCFDAGFFGFSPRDAELLDPQQRHFLECVWLALEDAGIPCESAGDLIGVYAGTDTNTYLINNIVASPTLLREVGGFAAVMANDKDFVASRVSYKLGLQGPSVAVQSACSTSLVAVCMACLALRDRQCDVAIAGGASIRSPHIAGYVHEPGSIHAVDGHCRGFDQQATGTVTSSGVGVVVLQRLEDALSRGSLIRAVITGSAINNDGSQKVNFSAPSAAAQAAVIRLAQDAAGLKPEQISYLEAHGTGTPIGDAIELQALNDVFGRATRAAPLDLGSLKSNMGHLGAAAGVAGLIKAVLSLQRREIAPHLHFTGPNSTAPFSAKIFRIPTQMQPWDVPEGPRHAGVSSFGVGGTNAHVVLTEAPSHDRPAEQQGPHVLLLSARTREALASAVDRLCRHIEATPDIDLSAAAATLAFRRRHFPIRCAAVGSTASELVRELRKSQPMDATQASAQEMQLAKMRRAAEQSGDRSGTGRALAHLWCLGASVDWESWGMQRDRLIRLPGYPFEGRRYWVVPESMQVTPKPAEAKPPAVEHAHPRPLLSTAYSPPQGPEEQALAAIWSEVLGVEPIGRDDDFEDLGGHSLSAVRLVARIKESFSVAVPVRDFYTSQTIAMLAQQIARQSGGHHATPRSHDEARPQAPAAADSVALIKRPAVKPAPASHAVAPGRGATLSVFFFAGAQEAGAKDAYQLVQRTAQFADEMRLEAIWVPDRHFNRFGGLYPSPAVLAASLARLTKHLQLRAGSVVLPARHPVRVAEEWSMVDNLSGGRTGIALASGFHPVDFIFRPDNFSRRFDHTLSGLKTIRKLWAGEAVECADGNGQSAAVTLFPRPLQPQLPLWLTSSGNPATFKAAGEAGTKVLTAPLELNLDQLAERVALYYDSYRSTHGTLAGAGVTAMLHSYVGTDDTQARAVIGEPFREFLRTHADLSRGLLVASGMRSTLEQLSAQDVDDIIQHAFERFYTGPSLMGSPQKCRQVLERLVAAGITEVACLVDIGLEFGQITASLERLDALMTDISGRTGRELRWNGN